VPVQPQKKKGIGSGSGCGSGSGSGSGSGQKVELGLIFFLWPVRMHRELCGTK